MARSRSSGIYLQFFTGLTSIVLLLQACTAPKKFQPGKPFVFKNTITVAGKMPSDQKKALVTRLRGQLDDSLRIRLKSYAGIYREIQSPAVFDSASIGSSKIFMDALMKTEGYFRSTIRDSITYHTYPGNFAERVNAAFMRIFRVPKTQQIRTHTYFTVFPGPALLVDSIGYDLADSSLQSLAERSISRTRLPKGKPFRQNDVSAELERLSDLFRNNGYFKFSPDDLYAEADTVNLSLLAFDNDPFEQIQLLEDAKKRMEKPVVKVLIKLRPVTDTSKLLKHYVGNIRIFPEFSIAENIDSSRYRRTGLDGFSIFYLKDQFKPKFLVRQSRLMKDSLYRQFQYTRTVNNYNQMDVWQQVTLEATGIRYDSVPKIDFDYKLVPALKQSLIFELEGSRNTSSEAFASGNLLGLGANIGMRNRNVAREAIQSNTRLRAGIEINPSRDANFILTRQISLNHGYAIPRPIISFMPKDKQKQSARTLINGAAGYTERKDYFNLGNLNTSVGFEWSDRNNAFLIRPLNIEWNRLTRKPGLDSLIKANPLLSYNFSDGLIVGAGMTYVYSRSRGPKYRYLRLAVEESGGLTGALFKGLYNDLYRFVKFDAEYRFYFEREKSTWAFRLLGGYGYAYGKNPDKNLTLPFFRQYFSGGPNSMRAWGIRSLGPGSVGVSDTAFNKDYPPNLRLGDIQLEGNIEYRFNLGSIGGIKLKSAFFTDIGNIWYRNSIKERPDVARDAPIEFNLKRIGRDLAIAGGTSFRLDFDYFLIRFDWAYKLKDPYYADFNNGWFHDLRITNGQLQLGIEYPF